MTGTLRSRGYPLAEIARTLHVPDVSVRRWISRAEQAAKLVVEQAARAAKRGRRGRP